MVAAAPRTLWSLTADRQRPGSLAQSVERLGLAARAVRDQMSNDTWMVLGAVERALAQQAGSPPESARAAGADDTALAAAQQQTLAGMLALSGMAAESMVHDVGWTMMDIGKRIERGLALTALLRATLTTVRSPAPNRRSPSRRWWPASPRCIYRRRNLGKVSVAAVAELRAVRRREPAIAGLPAGTAAGRTCGRCPASSGSSRPERLVDEIGTRLRRLDPDDLEEVDADGRRVELDGLLERHARATCASCPTSSPRTQLSLPGDMQPLWGPDQRRVMP